MLPKFFSRSHIRPTTTLRNLFTLNFLHFSQLLNRMHLTSLVALAAVILPASSRPTLSNSLIIRDAETRSVNLPDILQRDGDEM